MKLTLNWWNSTQYKGIAMGLTSLLLLVLAIKKAATAPFTHDESYTYLNFTHNSFIDVISLKDSFTNNHLLNTLLIKYTETIFGNSEIALRSPNILAFGLFLFFLYKMAQKSSTITSMSLLIITGCCIPLFDIFTLARGYGLSIAFMVGSFYFMLQYLTESKKKFLYAYHILALLGVLSNFTVLIFYSSSLPLSVLFQVLKNDQKITKIDLLGAMKAHFIPLIISFVFLYEPIRRVKGQSFDFGGKESFFNTTLPSFFSPFFHGTNIGFDPQVATSVLVISILAISSYQIIRNQLKQPIDELTISTSLLLTMMLAIIAQHKILGTDYPIGRFALFLFPLFVLQIFFLLQSYKDRKTFKGLSLIFVGVACFGLLNFSSQLSFKYHQEWKYDMHTPLMLEALNTDRKQNAEPQQMVRLGVDWYFEPSINYYRKRNNLTWLHPVTRDRISKDFDYLYFHFEGNDQLKTNQYRVVSDFFETKTRLIKVLDE
ncbi:MAG: hypothetical protein KDC83_09165 [Flavobacteriales bacterium]|nr:hypothetical protein [Flavobacteriales bacterium]